MADAITRALADLERQLSALDPQVRKDLLSETANHLEDLRLANEGDAEAAVLEFGDIRKVGAALRQECGPRRSRALAVLTFLGPMLLVVGIAVDGSGFRWEFGWFVPPLLFVFGVVAYRTKRFAWREIGTGALVGAGATWLFLAAATIDMGEKDGYSFAYAPEAERVERNSRAHLAQYERWEPLLGTMRRAYDRGDATALASLTSPDGFLVLRSSLWPHPPMSPKATLQTGRTMDLGEAKALWRSFGRTSTFEIATSKAEALRTLEGLDGSRTIASRFVPQLGGYLQTACQVAAYAFGLGAGIHLLILGLRFVVETIWRRFRLGVAG